MSISKLDVKLFNKWSFDDVEIKDPTLENYINLRLSNIYSNKFLFKTIKK